MLFRSPKPQTPNPKPQTPNPKPHSYLLATLYKRYSSSVSNAAALLSFDEVAERVLYDFRDCGGVALFEQMQHRLDHFFALDIDSLLFDILMEPVYTLLLDDCVDLFEDCLHR